MEEEEHVTYTGVSHQGAVKMLWLYFWWSFCFVHFYIQFVRLYSVAKAAVAPKTHKNMIISSIISRSISFNELAAFSWRGCRGSAEKQRPGEYIAESPRIHPRL